MASKVWKGRGECVLKGNERGLFGADDSEATRRDVRHSSPPQSLFSIQAATFSKNAVASFPLVPPLSSASSLQYSRRNERETVWRAGGRGRARRGHNHRENQVLEEASQALASFLD